MIQIYSAGNETFTYNGDAVLWCYTCDLNVELNGTWVLEMTAPIDKEGRWELITEEAVLKVPTFQDDDQLYRIKKINKTDTMIQATAYPIFYDSADDAFLLDVRPTNKTGQEALNIMCDGTPYSGQSNITTVKTAYFQRRNLLNAIIGDEDPTFLERWGGEVLFDNYTVIINTHVGGDYGVEARYGKNINGMSYMVDTSELVTRIVPVAYNGHMMSGSTPWIDSSHINSYAKVYTKEIRYENIRMVEDSQGAPDGTVICNTQQELNTALTAAANADFATGIDTPKVSMDIDMAVIQNMAVLSQEHLLDSDGNQIDDVDGNNIDTVTITEYANLDKVRLGDTVKCRDTRIDVTSTSRVISLTWDCIQKKVTHVTLGDFKFSFLKNVSKAVNRVNNAFTENGSVMAEKVAGFLDGAQAQFRTQYNLATHSDVLAILFENLDTTSPMYGAVGIGTQGLCISKTRTSDGRDWDWTTGITANGLYAGMGIFGIIADKTGTNWWNMDTGEFIMGATSGSGGKTITEYIYDINQAFEAYKDSNDDVIADIQSQLDGAICSWFYNYAPTLNNYPASDWTTEALKEEHQGDQFYDKSTGDAYRFFKDDTTQQWGWYLITSTAATQALALASEAKDTADGKRRVFVVQPTGPYDVGDLWYTGTDVKVCMTANATQGGYDSQHWVKKDNYTDDSALTTFINGAFADLVDSNDDKIETWYQTADPSTSWTTAALKAEHTGDIWQNSSSQQSYRWNGATWDEMTTTPPQGVMDTIDGKSAVWRTQPSPPYDANDLWFQGATGDILTCVKSRSSGTFQSQDWVKLNKYTDNSYITDWIADTYNTNLASLQEQIDRKIETWYQAADPSLEWDENVDHTGDLWHRTTDNTEWRYDGSAWIHEEIPDELFDMVDGKSSIFTSSSTPSGAQNGDLWFRGTSYPIYTMVNGAWVEYNKYTSDENLDDFVDNTFTPWKTSVDSDVGTILASLDGQVIAAVINGNIINAINISTEGIAIQASKLNINGVTSINNGFKVNTNGSFEANSGSIGQIHVTSTSIYSGSHTTYNSSDQGFYLDKDGKFGLGNSTNYLRWSGSSLDLKVSSLMIGGADAATQTYAANQASTAQSNAISTAATDATSKANAAQSAAISAAASDATTKANAAQAAAISAAATDASTKASNAQSAAISAAASDATTKANAAQSAAISTAASDATTKANAAQAAAISTAAADATTKANEAAKTATNYLYYASDVGLVMSQNGSSYTSGYNTRLLASGIYFYDRTSLLAELTGSALKFYYSGTERMRLSSSGITFYKTDGSTTAASVTSDGFVLGTGTIAGFTFGSNTISSGTLGTSNSVFISPGTSGTSGYADIAGSGNISGWAFTAGSTFGVTKGGKLYCTNIQATAGTIGNFTLTSTELKYGNWVTSGGMWLVPAGKSGSINGSSQTFALVIGNTFGVTTAGGLHAASGRIGGINISSTAIYSGSKSTYDSTSNGFCFDSSGNIGIGGSSHYIRWNGSELNMSGKLQMKTGSSIEILSSGSTPTTVFGVSSAGAITAKSGTIGNFTLTATELTYGTIGSDSSLILAPAGKSGTICGVTGSWALTLGSKFGVQSNGYLAASYGRIASLTMENGKIYSGSHSTYNSSSQGFCLDKNGYFGVGDGTNYLRWDGTDLTVSGKLTMKTGSSIEIQSGGSTVFGVTSAGSLTAKKGTIGSLTIESDYLHFYSITSNTKFWIVPKGYADAVTINGSSVSNLALIVGSNFGVTRTGAMYSKSGQIGGWTIGQNGLTSVNDNAFFQIADSKLKSSGGAFVVQYGMHIYADPDEMSDGNRQFKLFGLGTSATGNYLRLAGSNIVGSNSSSSRRYKIVGRELTSDDVENAYNVEVRMAKYKGGYLIPGDEREGKEYPMFIAEQVDEWLPDAIDHNDDGQAENWNDRVMIPIMFQMIKDLKTEIEALKKQKGIA